MMVMVVVKTDWKKEFRVSGERIEEGRVFQEVGVTT